MLYCIMLHDTWFHLSQKWLALSLRIRGFLVSTPASSQASLPERYLQQLSSYADVCPSIGSTHFKHFSILFYNKVQGTPVVLGGLVVSVLATGPKVRGFDPDRCRWIFKGDKSVPCRRFTACKRRLKEPYGHE